jgi:hypothetical protein
VRHDIARLDALKNRRAAPPPVPTYAAPILSFLPNVVFDPSDEGCQRRASGSNIFGVNQRLGAQHSLDE